MNNDDINELLGKTIKVSVNAADVSQDVFSVQSAPSRSAIVRSTLNGSIIPPLEHKRDNYGYDLVTV